MPQSVSVLLQKVVCLAETYLEVPYRPYHEELGVGVITSERDADFNEKLKMLNWLMTINTLH